MDTLILILAYILNIQYIYAQTTITCGSTVTGTRTSNQEVLLSFISTGTYSAIYLEGCASTHDIWLEIRNSSGDTIADADDQFNHGTQDECGNPFAGDIDIPSGYLPVKPDDTFTFVVRGYLTASGSYSVTLYCTPLSPPTTSITCGSTVTGIRTSNQAVPLSFISTDWYSAIYLEGCASTHDIWLEIRDSSNITIADEDDQFNHDTQTNCGNRYAGDIDIPSEYLPVKPGDNFTFIVRGYLTAFGSYSVTLNCTQLSSPSPTPSPISSECPRHREPWHLISQTQRDLYINGFKQLARDGKMRVFTQTHGDFAISRQAHGSSAFLPWHRYFVWELETQFRSLGGAYSCFSLPYWDWTYDISTYGFDIETYQILNSGLSGAVSGGGLHGECVTGAFGATEYTPYQCYGLSPCCLRRDVCTSNCYMVDASGLMSNLDSYSQYGCDAGSACYGYRQSLEFNPHGSAHMGIGGNGHLGDIANSPDDPIFYLLHAFVDFNYALWQECRNYDNATFITNAMYGGNIAGVSLLDDVLIYTQLKAQSWSYVSSHQITIRDMQSIQGWDVSYDKGDFWTRARVDTNCVCKGNINPAHFYTSIRRRLANQKDTEIILTATIGDYGAYSDDIFGRLYDHLDKKGIANQSIHNAQIYKAWAKSNCEFLNIETPCYRPKYFDDCSDLIRVVNQHGHYDIDITLDELLDKVRDYPCMIKTRQTMYNWALQSGSLYELCGGQYDTFCDREHIEKGSQQQCLANIAKTDSIKDWDDDKNNKQNKENKQNKKNQK